MRCPPRAGILRLERFRFLVINPGLPAVSLRIAAVIAADLAGMLLRRQASIVQLPI
jgi:hypothetical protein